MHTPELNTSATRRVNDLLHSPEARRHLTTYGWIEGMPVVFARPDELADEIMGFVSVHGRAVLLVLSDDQADELQLWHVTVPSPIFAKVPPLPSGTTTAQLCASRRENRLITFRVAFWSHSAALHEIPCFVRNDRHVAVDPLIPRQH